MIAPKTGFGAYCCLRTSAITGHELPVSLDQMKVSSEEDSDDGDIKGVSTENDIEEVSLKELVEQLENSRRSQKHVSPVTVADDEGSEIIDTNVEDAALTLTDLVSAAELVDLKKRLAISNAQIEKKSAKKLEPLQPPLPARQLSKIKRSEAYKKTRDEISKWQPLVKANREADHLQFPIAQTERKTAQTIHSLAANFKPITEFEKELAAIQVSNIPPASNDNFNDLPDADTQKQILSARHAEIRLMRELAFREEQRSKRIAKIKSKSYRKMRRRDKLRLSALEKDSDEENNAQKLDEDRAVERMTLRHKNTGKWAKDMAKRGQTADPETRAAVTKQLQKGADLMEVKNGNANATVVQTSSVEKQFAHQLFKHSEEKTFAFDETPANPFLMRRKKVELKQPEADIIAEPVQIKIAPCTHDSLAESDDEGDLDAPSKMSYTKNKTQFQRKLVAKAFAGDDVVAEFAAEKEAVMEQDAPRDEDVTLPGWGSWVGLGVKKSKKRPLVVEHVPGIDKSKRKDAKLSNVIINEKKIKKADPYHAEKVPFPYENADQYHQSLRLPIGKEWSTRTTFQKLTKPRVIIRPGAIIDPIEAKFT